MWGDDEVLVFRQDFDEKCGVKKDAISKELWGQTANHIQGRGTNVSGLREVVWGQVKLPKGVGGFLPC